MNGNALPADLANNPYLDRWIRINADGVIDLFAGKVELGQGIALALTQIAADELDAPLSSIRLTAGNTDRCPDQGFTAGSLSVQMGGMAIRLVCAEVRQLFVQQAALRMAVAPEEILVEEGLFFSAGNAGKSSSSLGYHALAEEVDLHRLATGAVAPKASAARRICGDSPPRSDFARKLFGAGYIHDLELPGMLHARMVRPPSYSARLIAFDSAALEALQALPGLEKLVVDGRFIGVCALREEDAIAAAVAVRRAARWEETPDLPEAAESQTWLSALPSEATVLDQGATGAAPQIEQQIPQQIQQQIEQQVHARYSRPFIAHASIGPSCALASWQDGQLTVWTHAQGSFPQRQELAATFGLALSEVSVIHVDGAGCYGHNGADDAALDAAMLARACARPVRLQWSREDEFAWSPLGSAMAIEIKAGIDADGRIAHWQQDTWSHSHVQRPGTGHEGALSLLGAWHRDPPAPLPAARDFPVSMGGGGQRNAVPLYTMPARTVTYQFVPQRTLRTSALRTLGAFANVFAIESCMDELALLAGADPIAFRLAHLDDPRAAAVLEAAARASDWHAPKQVVKRDGAVRGRGIGFARYKNSGAYCAIVIEIEVTDRIVLDRVTVAVDAGEVINPDGVRNQIEGGVMQAASWALKEAVQWDRTRITSRDWEAYPILRFDEAPGRFALEIMAQPDLPPLGVGECAAGPTAAAIGNALADAIGIRARDLPLTPERLLAAIESA
ncbi:MAG: xanthine dehydrogenase family protein molybdopterin-binding subunit [Herbaspirillum sp.]|nr:xanthine dehydrogenase family protein molybdopterin-binding subunit [Herbaspirillum sp.]